MGRLAAVALLLSLPGCVGVAYDRVRVGLPTAVVDAKLLEPGRSTLREALEKLGPPDLLLRAGEVDRAYYVAWDSDYVKLVVEVALTRSFSWDAFILAIGSEDLWLARLEFNRAGILQTAQIAEFVSSKGGQYFALDNRIVSNFLEDRARALRLLEGDDDEEDVELDPRRKK